MSVTMEDGVKRWTTKRKSALVVESIQGKTTVVEASRTYDPTPSEIENWIDDVKKGMDSSDNLVYIVSERDHPNSGS